MAERMGMGNIPLDSRPILKNKDGSISTIRSFSVNIDGEETLLPLISEEGKELTPEEAIKIYESTGKHLGKFKTPEEATNYAKKLSNKQGEYYLQNNYKGSPMANGQENTNQYDEQNIDFLQTDQPAPIPTPVDVYGRSLELNDRVPENVPTIQKTEKELTQDFAQALAKGFEQKLSAKKGEGSEALPIRTVPFNAKSLETPQQRQQKDEEMANQFIAMDEMSNLKNQFKDNYSKATTQAEQAAAIEDFTQKLKGSIKSVQLDPEGELQKKIRKIDDNFVKLEKAKGKAIEDYSTKLQEIDKEMSTVTSRDLFAERSTWSKVLMAIGAAFSGYAGRSDAVKLIEMAINSDLKKQQMMTNKLKNLGISRKTAFDLTLKKINNDQAALELTKAALLDRAKNEYERILAKAEAAGFSPAVAKGKKDLARLQTSANSAMARGRQIITDQSVNQDLKTITRNERVVTKEMQDKMDPNTAAATIVNLSGIGAGSNPKERIQSKKETVQTIDDAKIALDKINQLIGMLEFTGNKWNYNNKKVAERLIAQLPGLLRVPLEGPGQLTEGKLRNFYEVVSAGGSGPLDLTVLKEEPRNALNLLKLLLIQKTRANVNVNGFSDMPMWWNAQENAANKDLEETAKNRSIFGLF